MDAARLRGLIVAYFLSRENERAYHSLGTRTQRDAHEMIGEKLGVPPNTVKNWRDEFDAVHDNSRQGWYQRPLRPSRVRVLEQYQSVSFEALERLVHRIIDSPVSHVDLELPAGVLGDAEVPGAASDDDSSDVGGDLDNQRAETGRLAEDFFESFFSSNQFPVRGKLVDRRQSGEGFDYEIETDSLSVFVEVKGLSQGNGSVSMTGREWITAKALGDRYYLFLVMKLRESPVVHIVANPGRRLSPKLRIFSVMQETWTVQASAVTQAAL